MNLVPPTHGRALVQRTVAREILVDNAEKRLREQMLDEMDSLFRREVGATAPREWLSWERLPRDSTYEMEIRLLAEAPTRSQTYFDAHRQETRTVPIALTAASRIPIVPTTYRYEDTNPFRRIDHVLTFKGWDAATGLMVFDR